ncbi:hypothetical protein [Effusibacillus lacus]|uniref:Uncharacterized protein n=1 Tax=Effusibacillus lacus TaxID=1348429 RepID=A0A292YPV8_9BACL|nr:hypothetical protein [Effusibacillus lacus]TCS76883.1 hypothetical protein EDD64_101107 [Effusibacillus lacus]GAX91216.1 hypothetical protein EFBL_2882 [Effusibacillus lacus]
MTETGYVLSFRLENETKVAAVFESENDRDGCEISLGMYRSNLGPITREVWERMVGKFNGKCLE